MRRFTLPGLPCRCIHRLSARRGHRLRYAVAALSSIGSTIEGVVVFRLVDARGDRPHPHRLRPERPHQVTRPRKSVRLWYRNGRIGRPRRAGYARCSDAVPYHIATSRLIEHVGRPEIASPHAVESTNATSRSKRAPAERGLSGPRALDRGRNGPAACRAETQSAWTARLADRPLDPSPWSPSERGLRSAVG
jgi:hypothetical protein